MLKFQDFVEQIIDRHIDEKIRAEEAYYDKSAVQTVIDDRRDLGWIALNVSVDLKPNEFWDMIKKGDLKTLKVPKNPNNVFIYFRKGAEKKAKELKDIADKYDGYLAYNATKEESRRIGELLGYEEKDINYYLNKNYK